MLVKGTILGACKVVGVGRTTVYEWRANDPGFAAKMEVVETEITEILENHAMQRATEGVRRSVFFQGQAVGTENEYSDALLMFLLKARAPDKYKDRVRHEIDAKLIDNIVAEFVGALKKFVPTLCPHCSRALMIQPKIAQHLEALSQRLSAGGSL